MTRVRMWIVGGLIATSLAAVAAVRGDGTVFAGPPEDYVTARHLGAEFRHPPGMRAERLRDGVVVVRAPRAGRARTAPRIELRSWGARRDAAGLAARRLAVGEVTGETSYEIDVPQSDRSEASDVVFKTADGVQHRVTTVFAYRAGQLMTLTSRGRITNARDDPRNVAGSLRLLP